MRTRLPVVALLATLTFGAPALAAGSSASTEENIGVGSGLVIGALAGGPVGAVVGAAVGAKLGDTLQKRNETVSELTAGLEASRGEVGKLERDVARLAKDNRELDASLDEMRAVARPELVSLLEAGIELDLKFRTDEDVLAKDTRSRLEALAKKVASMPGVQVRLDGYSDERGDEAYNQALSERRAGHVRDLLVAGGIPGDRVRVNAHGESPASEATADSYALERRVSLTLYVEEGSQSFASNPSN